MPALKAGLTTEGAEGAEEGGVNRGRGVVRGGPKDCAAWKATAQRKGAKAQRGVGRAVGVEGGPGRVGARVGVQRRVAEGREAQRMGTEGSVAFAVNRDPRLP